MITREKGKWHLVCDVCEEEAEVTFNRYDDAEDFVSENDWEVKGRGHSCPECVDSDKEDY